jgi:hypothetical protein
MRSLPEHVRYRRTEDFVARRIAGETVLVPIRQRLGDLESIYTMNEVATFIWERLTEPITVAEIATAVETEFAGDSRAIRRDMEEFLPILIGLQAIGSIDERLDIPSPMPPISSQE